jgi:hypothetical protein
MSQKMRVKPEFFFVQVRILYVEIPQKFKQENLFRQFPELRRPLS